MGVGWSVGAQPVPSHNSGMSDCQFKPDPRPQLAVGHLSPNVGPLAPNRSLAWLPDCP